MFQNGIWLIEYNLIPRKSELYEGIINKIAIDKAKAITTPKLLVIDRIIAHPIWKLFIEYRNILFKLCNKVHLENRFR